MRKISDCNMTGKQRMLNAYRGLPNDRPAVTPECATLDGIPEEAASI